MTDTLPDRLSNNPKGPFYDAGLLERGVGKTVDRHGAPLAMKMQGTVEPYLRDAAAACED